MTLLIKPVAVCLRRQGHILAIYSDGVLIMTDSHPGFMSAISDTIKLLTELGFVINESLMQKFHKELIFGIDIRFIWFF